VATVQAGSVLGNLVGALIPGIMIILLPAPAMVSWGWRIPFLVAVVLGLAGVYIRRRLEETPYFLALEQEGSRAKNPLAEALTGRAHLVALARAFGVVALNGASFFLIVGYLPTFASTSLHLTGWAAFAPPVIALAAALVAIFVGAALSDRIGRRKVLLWSAGGLVVLAYPCFALITSGTYGLIVVGLVVFGLLSGAYGAVTQVTLAEMFPTKVRVSGHGVAYNLAVAIFGGTAPYLLTALNGATGSKVVGAYFIAVVALLSLLVVLTVRETAGNELRQV
jgi:MHS family proline/betaine transporter-like MFS transporter